MSISTSRLPPALRRLAKASAGVLALAGVAGPIGAATDGAFGLVSQASTEVSIIVGDTAQATGLDDIVLAPWSDGQPAPRGTTNACIYTSTGLYQVAASSSNGAGGRFRLQSGADFIVYDVRWNDGVSGLQTLTNGVPRTGLIGDNTSVNCGGADPATVQVNISLPRIQAATIGLYADTLTLIITPQ